MTFAVVIGFPWIARTWSFDIGLLVRTLRAQGHDALIVCAAGSQYDADTGFPVREAAPEQLVDPEWWKASGIEAALAYTWLYDFGDMIAAMHQGGVFTISKGDTTGGETIRLFPRDWVLRNYFERRTLGLKLRGIWYLLRLYLYAHRGHAARVIRNLESADITIIETDAARADFRRFLAYYGRSELDTKVRRVPNPVRPHFLIAELPDQKRPRSIVAVGAWDRPEKDTRLLAGTLDGYLSRYPDAEAVMIGRGGDRWFTPLKRHPGFQHLGPVPNDQIPGYLASARVCLVTSYWESFHIGAHEALCMGCTVVGPPLVGLRDMVAAGPYGTLSPDRRRAAMTGALEREMLAWERGERDLRASATYWRDYLSPDRVARQLVEYARQKEEAAV